MNNKKLKKYFKILFVPISLLIFLSIFLINTFASPSYIIEDNGDIQSLNIYNNNLYPLTNKRAINDGDGITIYILDDYSSTLDYIPIDSNVTYTITASNTASNFNVQVLFYDSSKNYIGYTPNTTPNTFTTPNNTSFYRLCVRGENPNVMLNEGYIALDYFPYGVYSSSQIDNFMEYLIGENYFSSGRAMIYQTNTESPYWDREIYSTNRSCSYQIGSTSIGDYIVGKTLYLQNLSYDLVEGLKLESNYVYARNTTISLKPSFNFANSSITYLNIPCKFLNLDIYCPNGSFECSCYVGNGLELGADSSNDRVYFQQNGDYIHIDFDDDDNRWMFEIEIVLNHSNNTFVAPSNIISNTNDTLQWDLYQIGYDDGYRGQEGKISYLQYQINELNSKVSSLNNANNILREQNEQLRNSLNNNFGFDDVFFALADTPFKTVSNMLGFDLFGVNLFNALVGFITVLACIWLLKKFL